MTGLEDDLRATLGRHAVEAERAADAPMWSAPGAGQRAGRAAWLLPTIAAASALVFAAGAGAVIVSLNSSEGAPASIPLPTISLTPSPSQPEPVTSSPVPTQSASPSRAATGTPTPTRSATRSSTPSATPTDTRPAKPPKGQKAYRYRGVEVFVDSYLDLDAWECGQPVRDTIVVGPPPTACDEDGDGLTQSQSDGIFVYLVPSDSELGQKQLQSSRVTRRIDFFGETAYVSSGCKRCSAERLSGTQVLYLPERKVVVAVDGGGWISDPAAAILETVRFVGE